MVEHGASESILLDEALLKCGNILAYENYSSVAISFQQGAFVIFHLLSGRLVI